MRRQATIAAGVLLAVAPTARAGFMDASVRLDFVARYDGGSDTYATKTATVGNGVEFVAYADGLEPTFDVDLADTTIHVGHFVVQSPENTTFSDPPFLGLVFVDAANAVPPILSVTVLPTPTAIQGVTAGYDDDVIEMNLSGLTFGPQSTIDLAVTFAGVDPPVGVPEPASLAAAAIATLAMLRRSRSTKSPRSL